VNILILGVNGFLGPAISAGARALGFDVCGLSRSATPGAGFDGAYISGDRCDTESVRRIVEDRSIEVVVDVIPMVLADTAPLLGALDGLVFQYVMLSSCDVYRNYELLHRRRSGTPIRSGIRETGPMRESRYPYRLAERRPPGDPGAFLDDYDKIPIEEVVRSMTSGWTILRLPMVYGPGDGQRRFRWAIEPMKGAGRTLALPASWAAWTSTYGYVDNVAHAIAVVLGETGALGRVFNVAEPAPRPHLEWMRRIARVMGWDGTIEMDDDPRLVAEWGLDALDLSVPLIVKDHKIRESLGYEEVVDAATCLERTIADELSR
jgi:nucleoside-diphosphate-sugar epimerase